MIEDKHTTERIGAVEAAIAQMRMEAQEAQETQEAEMDHIFGGDVPIVPIGGGDAGGMFAWDESEKKIMAGNVMIGRDVIGVAGTEANTDDGTYQIEVDMETRASKIVKGGTQSNDDKAYIPLYTITDGVMVDDRRGMFCIQRWED